MIVRNGYLLFHNSLSFRDCNFDSFTSEWVDKDCILCPQPVFTLTKTMTCFITSLFDVLPTPPDPLTFNFVVYLKSYRPEEKVFILFYLWNTQTNTLAIYRCFLLDRLIPRDDSRSVS